MARKATKSSKNNKQVNFSGVSNKDGGKIVKRQTQHLKNKPVNTKVKCLKCPTLISNFNKNKTGICGPCLKVEAVLSKKTNKNSDIKIKPPSTTAVKTPTQTKNSRRSSRTNNTNLGSQNIINSKTKSSENVSSSKTIAAQTNSTSRKKINVTDQLKNKRQADISKSQPTTKLNKKELVPAAATTSTTKRKDEPNMSLRGKKRSYAQLVNGMNIVKEKEIKKIKSVEINKGIVSRESRSKKPTVKGSEWLNTINSKKVTSPKQEKEKKKIVNSKIKSPKLNTSSSNKGKKSIPPTIPAAKTVPAKMSMKSNLSKKQTEIPKQISKRRSSESTSSLKQKEAQKPTSLKGKPKGIKTQHSSTSKVLQSSKISAIATKQVVKNVKGGNLSSGNNRTLKDNKKEKLVDSIKRKFNSCYMDKESRVKENVLIAQEILQDILNCVGSPLDTLLTEPDIPDPGKSIHDTSFTETLDLENALKSAEANETTHVNDDIVCEMPSVENKDVHLKTANKPDISITENNTTFDNAIQQKIEESSTSDNASVDAENITVNDNKSVDSVTIASFENSLINKDEKIPVHDLGCGSEKMLAQTNVEDELTIKIKTDTAPLTHPTDSENGKSLKENKQDVVPNIESVICENQESTDKNITNDTKKDNLEDMCVEEGQSGTCRSTDICVKDNCLEQSISTPIQEDCKMPLDSLQNTEETSNSYVALMKEPEYKNDNLHGSPHLKSSIEGTIAVVQVDVKNNLVSLEGNTESNDTVIEQENSFPNIQSNNMIKTDETAMLVDNITIKKPVLSHETDTGKKVCVYKEEKFDSSTFIENKTTTLNDKKSFLIENGTIVSTCSEKLSEENFDNTILLTKGPNCLEESANIITVSNKASTGLKNEELGEEKILNINEYDGKSTKDQIPLEQNKSDLETKQADGEMNSLTKENSSNTNLGNDKSMNEQISHETKSMNDKDFQDKCVEDNININEDSKVILKDSENNDQVEEKLITSRIVIEEKDLKGNEDKDATEEDGNQESKEFVKEKISSSLSSKKSVCEHNLEENKVSLINVQQNKIEKQIKRQEECSTNVTLIGNNKSNDESSRDVNINCKEDSQKECTEQNSKTEDKINDTNDSKCTDDKTSFVDNVSVGSSHKIFTSQNNFKCDGGDQLNKNLSCNKTAKDTKNVISNNKTDGLVEELNNTSQDYTEASENIVHKIQKSVPKIGISDGLDEIKSEKNNVNGRDTVEKIDENVITDKCEQGESEKSLLLETSHSVDSYQLLVESVPDGHYNDSLTTQNDEMASAVTTENQATCLKNNAGEINCVTGAINNAKIGDITNNLSETEGTKEIPSAIENTGVVHSPSEDSLLTANLPSKILKKSVDENKSLEVEETNSIQDPKLVSNFGSDQNSKCNTEIKCLEQGSYIGINDKDFPSVSNDVNCENINIISLKTENKEDNTMQTQQPDSQLFHNTTTDLVQEGKPLPDKLKESNSLLTSHSEIVSLSGDDSCKNKNIDLLQSVSENGNDSKCLTKLDEPEDLNQSVNIGDDCYKNLSHSSSQEKIETEFESQLELNKDRIKEGIEEKIISDKSNVDEKLLETKEEHTVLSNEVLLNVTNNEDVVGKEKESKPETSKPIYDTINMKQSESSTPHDAILNCENVNDVYLNQDQSQSKATVLQVTDKLLLDDEDMSVDDQCAVSNKKDINECRKIIECKENPVVASFDDNFKPSDVVYSEIGMKISEHCLQGSSKMEEITQLNINDVDVESMQCNSESHSSNRMSVDEDNAAMELDCEDSIGTFPTCETKLGNEMSMEIS